MSELALLGGVPVRREPFPVYATIGDEEKQAVAEVMESGVLSKFLGRWHEDFYGGPRVQALEKAWAEYFHVAHAVSMNSATSGLYAAVGAVGVGPGDEVIVSPYTMSASAACVLGFNAVPVFADIDPDTFCITAESIERVMTKRTKAIVVVDLFGQPADFDAIMKLAEKHNLKVIEDAAQAPGARLGNRYAGTLGHIGVFSLNYHKVIHCGEGGVAVTDDAALAERLQLIRNHGEVIVKDKGVANLVNMLGFNLRMGEIECAIAFEQLKKLDGLLEPRVRNANFLRDALADLPGLTPPVVPEHVLPAWYVFGIRLDADVLGVSRSVFAKALRAEGVPVAEGYVEPIYMQPMYQKKTLYGEVGCPFRCPFYGGNVSYESGICPVAERMHYRELIYGDYCHAKMSNRDVEDIAEAIRKVHRHRSELIA